MRIDIVIFMNFAVRVAKSSELKLFRKSYHIYVDYYKFAVP